MQFDVLTTFVILFHCIQMISSKLMIGGITVITIAVFSSRGQHEVFAQILDDKEFKPPSFDDQMIDTFHEREPGSIGDRLGDDPFRDELGAVPRLPDACKEVAIGKSDRIDSGLDPLPNDCDE